MSFSEKGHFWIEDGTFLEMPFSGGETIARVGCLKAS